jgi:hypothetical protein
MTLEEKFIGKKQNVLDFIVFGCIAYVHVLDDKRSKLDPKVEMLRLMRWLVSIHH